MNNLDDEKAGYERASDAVQRLLIHDGLYRWIDLTTPDGTIVLEMITNETLLEFDHYCPSCKMVTPYKIKTGRALNRLTESRHHGLPVPNIIVLNAVCLRAPHYMSFVLHRSEKRLMKIGQLPSIADLAFAELKEVDGALDPIDRKELGRALGLFAHDAPLGAFVYLRRVFERMIERAHARHQAVGASPIEGFSEMKVDQRIKNLRDQLPAKVVQNSNVFGVLSKGIHELSDEEGRELFPLVKSVIFQMLGDEERLKQAREQERSTDLELARVIERLSNRDDKVNRLPGSEDNPMSDVDEGRPEGAASNDFKG